MVQPIEVMIDKSSTQPSADGFGRTMMMVIIVMGVLGTVIGWYIMGTRGSMSPALTMVQAITAVVLLALFFAAWWRLLPQRVIGLCCLVYAVGTCAACMALRMYWPRYGAAIDLEPLYLWFPVLYVFAFVLTNHRTGLVVSLGIMLLFLGVSLPYLVHDIDAPYANITVQLHVISGAMIATLYFFSGYQHRLRLAQATVDELAHLSSTDELTKLPNRRHMAEVIGRDLANFQDHGEKFAVMLFDIDDFKAINDRFGHDVGDAALVALAARAAQGFHGVGGMGRWGGDEFLALVRNVDPAEGLRRADGLCRHIAAEPLLAGLPVTVSCGVTVVRGGDSCDSLLQRADAALYAAKRGGRNRAESVVEPERICALDPLRFGRARAC